MKFAIAAVLIALASQAAADHTGKPYKPASAVIVPPPEFNNQMGARYTGTFKRILTTHAEVQRLCAKAGPNPLACAKFPKGRPATGPAPACTVIMPNNLPPDLFKAVNTHEFGHCMGFRH
jgi:hypothetical protein